MKTILLTIFLWLLSRKGCKFYILDSVPGRNVKKGGADG